MMPQSTPESDLVVSATAGLRSLTDRRRMSNFKIRAYHLIRSAGALVAAFIALSPAPATAATFGDVTSWCSATRVAGNDVLCGTYVTGALELLRTSDPVLN